MKNRAVIDVTPPSFEETARTMKIPMKRAREIAKLAEELYRERMAGRKGAAAAEFKRKRRKVSTEKAKARLRKALKPPAEVASHQR